jgi:hypothetical protein
MELLPVVLGMHVAAALEHQRVDPVEDVVDVVGRAE